MPFTVVVLRHPMSVCQPIGAGCSQVQVQQALPGDWIFFDTGSTSAIATGIICSHPILVSQFPIPCAVSNWIRTVGTACYALRLPLFTIFTRFIVAYLRNRALPLRALVLTGGDSACLVHACWLVVQIWMLQHTSVSSATAKIVHTDFRNCGAIGQIDSRWACSQHSLWLKQCYLLPGLGQTIS